MKRIELWLMRHETLYFIVKSLIYILRGNKEYIHSCAYMKDNPDMLHLYHYGNENSGKIIYHITERGNGYGFFAEFKAVLEELLYAERMGFAPVVTFGKDFLYYDEELSITTDNAFCYFFEPVGEEKNLENSMNVVMARECHCKYIEDLYGATGYSIPLELQTELVRILSRYIKIKNGLCIEFDTMFREIFPDENILGVHYRGTDFKKGYYNHPVAVSLEQLISEVKEVFEQGNFAYIFLATDVDGTLDALKKEFGDCVRQFQDVYRGDSDVSVAFSKSDRTRHHYRLGIEVLRDAYALSRCQGLVAGLSQVSFSSRLLKMGRGEMYRSMRIINNGINKDKRMFH